ncbi:MAG TPA: protein-glutamate O-methyltransferase [Dissulfurispiraceae bacterium]
MESKKITQNTEVFKAAISGKDFSRLSEFIHNECGIKMPPAKKTMLEARLLKRLRKLGIRSFAEYCDYVLSPEGAENELVHMIDVVTTNKTDFFREPVHFEYLTRTALPELIKKSGAGISKNFVIWSAGCSSGEEPYSLAIALSEFAGRYPGFRFTVLATDISTRMLEKAKTGIYEEERADPVPMQLKCKYFLRSKDRSKGLVRIVPELREMVKFRRLNFMDDDFGFREKLDIIFCRNVIIYFDRPTQEALINRFCRYLIPGGYIFMGHSETLHGLDVPLVQAAPTIYRRPL